MPGRIREYCRKTGQHVPENMGEIVRCIFESLAFRYRWTAEKLEALTGRKYPVINIVGGGTKEEMLSQFAADASGRTVCAGPVEATALGNIIGQALATGDIATLAEGRVISANSFENSTYLPADAELWEKAYQTYTEICRKGGESGIN
jgi:sugar (pentulose or hexulose) kinase